MENSTKYIQQILFKKLEVVLQVKFIEIQKQMDLFLNLPKKISDYKLFFKGSKQTNFFKTKIIGCWLIGQMFWVKPMFEIKFRWVSHTTYFSNFRINSLSKKKALAMHTPESRYSKIAWILFLIFSNWQKTIKDLWLIQYEMYWTPPNTFWHTVQICEHLLSSALHGFQRWNFRLCNLYHKDSKLGEIS